MQSQIRNGGRQIYDAADNSIAFPSPQKQNVTLRFKGESEQAHARKESMPIVECLAVLFLKRAPVRHRVFGLQAREP